ncbi:hypothetical protein [Brevibacillus sp. SYSU BS000544]|uniref:hypothetical protein n=1 Tax=Brevibacillus sp. SYSU BS000544 TaxID=3416443 RepID=UPI003CE4AEAF
MTALNILLKLSLSLILFSSVLSTPSISFAKTKVFVKELSDKTLTKIISSNLEFSYRKRSPMSLPQGKISNVALVKRVKLDNEEYALFTYILSNKAHFGIINPTKNEDGSWYFNQGSNGPIMHNPLETLIIQQVPLVIGGVINDHMIKKIKILFNDGHIHIRDIKSDDKYFLEIIKYNSPTVSKIEGLDIHDKVVFTSWDLEKPRKDHPKNSFR